MSSMAFKIDGSYLVTAVAATFTLIFSATVTQALPNPEQGNTQPEGIHALCRNPKGNGFSAACDRRPAPAAPPALRSAYQEL